LDFDGRHDTGLIFKLRQESRNDCFADADLAGLYGFEDTQVPISVKSHTSVKSHAAGYVLLLVDSPLLWVSHLLALMHLLWKLSTLYFL
jgi:hypothetical protein